MTGVDPLPLEHYREHWGDMPQPKFATPRDFSAPTLGTRQGDFARIWLRKPFMPFQQYISDVGGELRLNDSGLWVPRYTLIVVTAQRQTGKSHMSMARNGERCMTVPNWRNWYTAQTGQDARDQFLKFVNEIVDDSPLGKVTEVKRGKGEEQLVYPNGSTQRPVPPTEEKLHGKQGDSTDVDEAWAFDEEQGAAITQAQAPTKLTRPYSQTWIWSAGGTAKSTWLARLVAEGRAGENPRMCYIEFGIPDDADPEDLDVIAAYHPAFGHTVTMDALEIMRSDFTGDPAGWARAAGNRWTEVIGGAIAEDDWRQLQHGEEIPEGSPVAYGAARAADGSEVAIVAAAMVDNRIVCEVLEVLPTGFLADDHVIGWATDGPVAVDPTGPSKALAATLKARKARRLVHDTAGAGCSTLVDSVPSRAVRFRPHPAFDAAQKVAGTRTTGDGGKAWARVAAGASIAALEAAGVAVWALLTKPKPVGKPRVIIAPDDV